MRTIDHLPARLAYERGIERFTTRLNSYLGMMKHFNARKFLKNKLDAHPRIKLFFRFQDNLSKAVSIRKIMEKQHSHVWDIAMKRYHSQFRKSHLSRPFEQKGNLYNTVYFMLYGVNSV